MLLLTETSLYPTDFWVSGESGPEQNTFLKFAPPLFLPSGESEIGVLVAWPFLRQGAAATIVLERPLYVNCGYEADL